MNIYCRSTILITALAFLAGLAVAKNAQAASYYAAGVLKSGNVLSGADITDITDFRVTAEVPASSTVAVSFSQDRELYYSASGTKGAWTDCASGTTIVDLSELAWTGALLFYKLKLTTTDASSTPVVSEIRVNYDGTDVPAATSTRYGRWGVLVSENMLSGAEVMAISGFAATTSLPSGSVARIAFSQDQSVFYSASGTKGAWTELADGGNNLDLSGLSWSGASLYYKIRLEAMVDPAVQPKLLEARAVYEGEEPAEAAGDYDWTGVLLSSDLLASTTDVLTGREYFSYSISYLPFGASVYAQFSKDGTNFFSSAGTAWAWDDLPAGNGRALPLSGLDWAGEESFYYKLKFVLAADNSYSPSVRRAGLTYLSSTIGGESKGATIPMGTSTAYCIPGDTATCSPPVLELKFDEFSGTTTYDTSGNGNDGVFVSPASSPAWTEFGKKGSAIEFDGEDDYISIPDDASFQTNLPLTLSAWIKTPGFSSTQNIITTDDINPNYYGAWLQIDTSGFVSINYGDGGTQGIENRRTKLGASAISADTWHHIVAVIRGQADMDIFCDGKNNGGAYSGTGDAISYINSNMNIGRADLADNLFNGLIDDVRIYNYARTPAQIAWDYNRGAPIAHWSFDECSGGTIHDNSGNGNHGQLYLGTSGTTATGTCASSSDSFWYNGRSGKYKAGGSFDGGSDQVIVSHNTALNPTELSISAWVKVDALDGETQNIIAKGDLAANNGYGIALLENDHATLPDRFVFNIGSSGTFRRAYSKDSIVQDRWYHILGTHDSSSNFKLYIDGIFQTMNNNALTNTSDDIYIGGFFGYVPFDGQIDEVKIFNYALTAEQVKNEYNGGAVRFGN